MLRVQREAFFHQVQPAKTMCLNCYGEEVEIREEQKGEMKRRGIDPGLLAATPGHLPIANILWPHTST